MNRGRHRKNERQVDIRNVRNFLKRTFIDIIRDHPLALCLSVNVLFIKNSVTGPIILYAFTVTYGTRHSFYFDVDAIALRVMTVAEKHIKYWNLLCIKDSAHSYGKLYSIKRQEL
jgi:hypothetical protein